jgi:hypothetical protein
MQIVFTDPPSVPGHSIHPWGLIAEQLKARPNEWALCLREVVVSANQINAGQLNAFKPKGTFKARTISTGKKDEKGRVLVDLYVMYVGEPEGDTPE